MNALPDISSLRDVESRRMFACCSLLDHAGNAFLFLSIPLPPACRFTCRRFTCRRQAGRQASLQVRKGSRVTGLYPRSSLPAGLHAESRQAGLRVFFFTTLVTIVHNRKLTFFAHSQPLLCSFVTFVVYFNEDRGKTVNS
jgi:hypothetical protein